jgi:hypothetical protein
MSNLPESWRPVVGYEGVYEVSNIGRVRRSGRIIAQPLVLGYPSVHLCWLGIRKRHYVHRLVAKAFIGPPPEGRSVNHIDGNKSNPRVENLEYATAKENTAHAIRVLGCFLGERNGSAKLTEQKVRRARELCRNGRTQTAVATVFGVYKATISKAVRRSTWSHVL